MIIFDIETTGLNPFRDQVLTIQTKKEDDISVWKCWEKDEVSIIQDFTKFVRKVDEPLVGYNIVKFDVPFLLSRLLMNERLDDEVQKLFKSKNWVDIINFQKDSLRGMKAWAESLGIQKGNSIEGRHIPVLWDLGKYDEIVEHAVDDLTVCERIVEKLNLEKKFMA